MCPHTSGCQFVCVCLLHHVRFFPTPRLYPVITHCCHGNSGREHCGTEWSFEPLWRILNFLIRWDDEIQTSSHVPMMPWGVCVCSHWFLSFVCVELSCLCRVLLCAHWERSVVIPIHATAFYFHTTISIWFDSFFLVRPQQMDRLTRVLGRGTFISINTEEIKCVSICDPVLPAHTLREYTKHLNSSSVAGYRVTNTQWQYRWITQRNHAHTWRTCKFHTQSHFATVSLVSSAQNKTRKP